MTYQAIAILGGTFDPIHNGHLQTAVDLYQNLPLKETRLIPCKQPVHKDKAHASADQRLDMLKSAIVGEPGLVIDQRELLADRASYIVETLEELQADLPDNILCLSLGMDSFCSLPTWHRWQEIIELAHIIVIPRPGKSEQDIQHAVLQNWWQQRLTDNKNTLLKQKTGLIYQQPVTSMDISSTRVRELAAQGKSARYMVPEKVWDYIQKHNLYGYHS